MLFKKAKLKKLINKNKKISLKYLLSKSIKSCEASVEMNYPKSGKYSKIRPVIDWYPIIWGYLESIFDKVKFEK